MRTGKHAVICGNRAGFICPYLNDAVRMIDAQYAPADDIDVAMVKGCGHPRGPYALI